MKDIKDMTVDDMSAKMRTYECDKSKGYAFVSYSHQDREKVYPLVLGWMRAGYNIYIDLDFERHGSDKTWVEQMKSTLANRLCRLVVCFGGIHYTYSYAALLELLTIRCKEVSIRHDQKLPIDYFIIGDVGKLSMENNDIPDEYKPAYEEYFDRLQNIMGSDFLKQNAEEEKTLKKGIKGWVRWCKQKGDFDGRTAAVWMNSLKGAYKDGYMNFFPAIAKLMKKWIVSQKLNSNSYSLESDMQIRFERFDHLGIAKLDRESAVLLGSVPFAEPEDAEESLPEASGQKAPADCSRMEDIEAQYKQGRQFKNSKDYVQAAKWFEKAAERGYASAQTSLAYLYQHGYGVKKDSRKALDWYRKAAEQGDASGQYNLGWCYQKGKGVESDEIIAAKWYQKAADQGHANAQNSLGDCYRDGKGVGQNIDKAVEWYKKAAEQNKPGSAAARYNLGCCYEYGQGVEQNLDEAVRWYQRAAEKGNKDAKKRLENQ